MNQVAMFGPVWALIILTWIVWITMFARRIPFLNSLDLDPDQITPAYLAENSPPSVSNPSDNLKNLFEIPVLFYVLAVYLFVSQQVDQIYLVGAWLYVFLRYCHSLIHCSFNSVMARFSVYAASCVVLLLMTTRAVFSYALN